MRMRWVWALGLGLAVAVPVVALGVVAQAAPRDTVQLQAALDSSGVSHQETSLGDLVADAVRQAGGADIALVPADEILETTIPAGSVPPERFLKALRYGDDPTDTVVILKLTGEQLRGVAERSVSRAPQPFDGFLQVSGLQIRFDPSQPEGKRIRTVTVGGADVGSGTTYRVAVTRSLAEGSYGYFRFWNKADVVEDKSLPTVAGALSGYLAANKTLNVQSQNRITPQ